MQEKKIEYGITDPFEERPENLEVPELDGKLGMFILELEA
jgi:hypothetical protein